MNYVSIRVCTGREQNERVGMAVVPLALIPNVDPCLGRLLCLQPLRNCYLCGRAECQSLLLTPVNWHSETQLKYFACSVHTAPRGMQGNQETPSKIPGQRTDLDS